MGNKVLTLIGFAKKSGNLVSGVNTCIYSIKKGRVSLIILADDISKGSEKKIMKEVRRKGVRFIRYSAIEELSHAAGEVGRSVFGVLDDNFAESILEAAEGESKS